MFVHPFANQSAHTTLRYWNLFLGREIYPGLAELDELWERVCYVGVDCEVECIGEGRATIFGSVRGLAESRNGRGAKVTVLMVEEDYIVHCRNH